MTVFNSLAAGQTYSSSKKNNDNYRSQNIGDYKEQRNISHIDNMDYCKKRYVRKNKIMKCFIKLNEKNPEINTNTSEYWHTYINSRSKHSDKRALSDPSTNQELFTNFSYAGYKLGEKKLPTANSPIDYGNTVPEFDPVLKRHKIFDVTTYGAIADDNISDKEALLTTIAAAEDYVEPSKPLRGAIIYFPAGTFLLNEVSDMDGINPAEPTGTGDDDNRLFAAWKQPIYISESNIIVRGSGSDVDGTILHMEEHFEPAYSNNMWSTQKLLNIGLKPTTDDFWKVTAGTYNGPSLPSKNAQPAYIARVTKNVKRGTTNSVHLDDVSDLSVGEWVLLRSVDTRADTLKKMMSPYEVEPWYTTIGKAHWTGLHQAVDLREFHQITAIHGNRVRFKYLIHSDIEASTNADNFGWGIEKIAKPVSQVGIENIRFTGGWSDSFAHHASYVHDSGWSALQFNRTVDSWVKNVHFESWNDALTISNSASVTVQDVGLSGNPGHLSASIKSSTNVLMLNVDDVSDNFHSAGVSHWAAGSVILNESHLPTTSPNIHGAMPRVTLFDKMKGGWVHDRWGGAISNMSNHLNEAIFWNPENTSAKETNWELMQTDNGDNGRLVMPYIIGLHGNSISFADQKTYIDFVNNRHFDNGVTIVNFDENHASCTEAANWDANSTCDDPSTSDTYRTYVLNGSDAEFPAIGSPYPDDLSSYAGTSQAYEESLGVPVKPYSLYEAQLKQRLGKLPNWLIEATGKVRYVKFVANSEVVGEEGIEGNSAKGSFQVFDQKGYPINVNSWNIKAINYPDETVIDLGDYYEPTAFSYTPDPTSTGRIADYSILTSSRKSVWNSSELSGTFGASDHTQIISTTTDADLTPTALASSSVDQNLPANVTDNSLDSYWSAEGVGEWITLDLQDEAWIDGINIAFVDGSNSVSSFDVEVSLDYINWTLITDPLDASDDLMSSGMANSLESFFFSQPHKSRYVRITGNGTNINTLNQYSEVKVNYQDDAGLITNLQFNEGSGQTVSDVSGFNNNGQMNNFERNNGIIFDGIDDLIQIPDISYGAGNQLTTAMWIKMATQTATGFVISKSNWGGGNPFYIQVTPSGDLSVRVNGTGPTHSGALADGQWHHVTMVLNDTTLSLYTDGAFSGSKTVTPVENTLNITVGGTASGNYMFNGAVDDVRVYQTALDADAVFSLASSSNSIAGDPCTNPNINSLKVYLRLEDSGVGITCDASSNGNDGLLLGGIMWNAPSVVGWSNEITGITFNNTGDYVTLSDIDYGTNNQLSVALWTKFSPQNNTAFLLRKFNWGNTNPYYIQTTTSGDVSVRVNGSGANLGNLADDKWHHLTMTLEGTTLKAYLDGSFLSSTKVTPISNNVPVTIGGDASGNYPFVGSIDDVRIYDIVLSDNDIAEIASIAKYNNADACINHSEEGLVAYLPLQDENNSTCNVAGNDNAGQLSGEPTWYAEETWLRLDGYNDQIQLTDIGYGVGSEFSASIRVKFDAQPTDIGYIIQKSSKWVGDSPFLMFVDTDGVLKTFVNGSGVSASFLNDNEWHYITAVLEAETLSLYVDGELVETVNVSPLSKAGNLILGGNPVDATYRPFKGDIDNVRIYHRALNLEDINRIIAED
ncbi:LamG-like jellyroll fold domain-containing protein [Pseudocolwellia sp. HL-MZ19]|uniref:LamG-like jellyroll fold domain-containing protein n=1 Tax=Pseudocolwellia sp. HL-MZ19 TaxID=3400846 RepID=UPI003CF37258